MAQAPATDLSWTFTEFVSYQRYVLVLYVAVSRWNLERSGCNLARIARPRETNDEWYSKTYTHLKPLLSLLTGIYPEDDCEWPQSRKVNVKVVDMEIGPYQCSFHHLTDARILQEVANSKPSKAIATRLYLVEDMTPIVVEILGSALSCSEFKPSTSSVSND
jgi:hypothetical protein